MAAAAVLRAHGVGSVGSVRLVDGRWAPSSAELPRTTGELKSRVYYPYAGGLDLLRRAVTRATQRWTQHLEYAVLLERATDVRR